MRSRLTYANVVASLALFLALGGTSYAVIKLPRNSVGSREVRNRSLQAVDIAKGALPARGVRGPEGPTGASGPRGPSDVFTAHRTAVGLPTTGGAYVDIVTLNVPAGSWWVLGSVSMVNNPPGIIDAFRCGLAYGSTPGDVGAVLTLDPRPSGIAAGPLVVHEGRVLTAPGSIRLRCEHDTTIPGAPLAESAQLTAMRTDNLQIQPG